MLDVEADTVGNYVRTLLEDLNAGHRHEFVSFDTPLGPETASLVAGFPAVSVLVKKTSAPRRAAAVLLIAASFIGPGADLAFAAQERGLSQKAVEIARPFRLPITNSMAVSGIVANRGSFP